MLLRTCDYRGCARPAERDVGSCMICSCHRCLEHSVSPAHSCPTQEDNSDAFFTAYSAARRHHLEKILAEINLEGLIAFASSLRGGMSCNLPAWHLVDAAATSRTIDLKLVISQMGGQNCHLDVSFEDGVVWIARFRLANPAGPPLETVHEIFTSEAATLSFLAQTNVPVPKVQHVSFDGANVGRPFILMDKLPGEQLQWNDAPAQQKTKIMEQLADIFLELEKYSFSASGSLSSSQGNPLVGPFAQSRMFTTPSTSLGPFPTLKDALESIVKHELDMLDSGEVSKLAVDQYTTQLWRLEHIPQLVASLTDEDERISESFYLKHFDDKGDHILVDSEYNITGILDWEFASTEAKALAFSSPCMMWPVGNFYDGINKLSAEELEFADMFARRGRDDMARCVRQGRAIQRFLFFLGGGPRDKEELEGLFQGLRKALDREGRVESYQEWKDTTIAKLYNCDSTLRRLLQREENKVGQAE